MSNPQRSDGEARRQVQLDLKRMLTDRTVFLSRFVWQVVLSRPVALERPVRRGGRLAPRG